MLPKQRYNKEVKQEEGGKYEKQRKCYSIDFSLKMVCLISTIAYL